MLVGFIEILKDICKTDNTTLPDLNIEHRLHAQAVSTIAILICIEAPQSRHLQVCIMVQLWMTSYVQCILVLAWSYCGCRDAMRMNMPCALGLGFERGPGFSCRI